MHQTKVPLVLYTRIRLDATLFFLRKWKLTQNLKNHEDQRISKDILCGRTENRHIFENN